MRFHIFMLRKKFSAFVVSLVLGTGLGLTQTNYQRLCSFGPRADSGSSPRGSLIQGTDGFLYGTTYSGGSNGWGSVFKLSLDGRRHQILHHFGGTTLLPVSGVIEVADGFLYGTVPSGGANNAGIIYKIAKDGSSFEAIHEFNPAVFDGSSPLSGLLDGEDGYLYGTASSDGSNNFGTIFRIALSGHDYKVMHHFAGTDGKAPSAALIKGKDGNLYGTTRAGGQNGKGIVFRMSRDGSGFQGLHHFPGGTGDGAEPASELLQAVDGFLYGTTLLGGASDSGTIFRVDTNGGNYRVLYSPQIGAPGYQFVSGLTQGSDGYLYGTASNGGLNNGGVAFRIGTDGSGYTVLHYFTGAQGEGAQPYSPLLIAADGFLYGSTFFGGEYTSEHVYGVIYRLTSVPLPGLLSIQSITSGSVNLRFENGAGGRLYSIERSSSLLPGSWQSIASITSKLDGSFSYSDLNPTNVALFYRAVTQ